MQRRRWHESTTCSCNYSCNAIGVGRKKSWPHIHTADYTLQIQGGNLPLTCIRTYLTLLDFTASRIRYPESPRGTHSLWTLDVGRQGRIRKIERAFTLVTHQGTDKLRNGIAKFAIKMKIVNILCRYPVLYTGRL